MITLNTNRGTIKIELDTENAPVTCSNFEEYAKSGFFDGTIFHRVIPGFMIQGGGFTVDMEQKPTRDTIKNEADNGLKNVLGSVAMARTPDPDSASSQFFINVADNDFLNHTAPTQNGWGYCVFGNVVDGMNVVQEITRVATAANGMHQDVPVEPIVIESVDVGE